MDARKFRNRARLRCVILLRATALALAAWLVSGPAHAQAGDSDPQLVDTGEIDGDLAGVVAPQPQQPRYAPGALEAYHQQMRAYEEKVATEAEAQRLRAESFRRKRADYESELAAYQAARRRYEAERAEWEAEISRRR